MNKPKKSPGIKMEDNKTRPRKAQGIKMEENKPKLYIK